MQILVQKWKFSSKNAIYVQECKFWNRKDSFVENLNSRLKFWATIVCSVGNLKLSDKIWIVYQNKKSELMLMRRVRAYGSSCLQVILVCLHPFHRNSLFCNQKSLKKSKKITWNQYFRVQSHSRLLMLTIVRSSSSVPICNHLRARQANRK